MSRSQQVAETILAQLGGQRFKLMTGAKSFTSGIFSNSEPGVSFKLPGSKGMIITLNARDLYNIKYLRSGRFRMGEWIEGATIESAFDVGVEQLHETFTRMTGLHTTI